MNDDKIRNLLEEIKEELESRIKNYPGIVMLGVYNKQHNSIKQLLRYY